MAKKEKGWEYYSLMIITYATILMFGIVENVKGVTFTSIKNEFGARYDEQGYLVSFSWYGYVIFCLVCAFVINHYGIKPAIISGYILNGIGCIAAAYAPTFILVVISLMVLWMGFGFYEVGYNALASLLFTENSAIYVNLMHFFYGFGAIIGPQVASLLNYWLNDSYHGVYKGLFVVILILFILSAIIPYTALNQNANSSESENQDKVTIGSMFKMPYIWWAAFTLGFMEVIEFIASNWGILYYRDVYGLDPNKEGALFVSCFYILFTISRFVSGFFIEKMGYYTYFFSSYIIVAVIYVIGFVMGVNGRWVIPFTGFFIGPMFPTFMCVLMKVFGNEAGNMSSIVIFISGATNGIIQLIIGYINEWIGYEWGFRCSVIYSLIPFALLAVTKKVGYKVMQKYNKEEWKKQEMMKTKQTEDSKEEEEHAIELPVIKEEMNKSVDVPKEQEQANTQDLIVVNIQEKEETPKDIVVQEVQNIENLVDSNTKEENNSVSITTKSEDHSI